MPKPGPRQLAFPGMAMKRQPRTAKDALQPNQFHWHEIVAAHPEMAEHEDAVNHLAHAHDGDPEAEGSPGVDGMKFSKLNVPLDRVRNVKTGDGHRDPRTAEASKGYYGKQMTRDVQDHGVPPTLLVKRGRNYEVADGHHRSEAAKMSTHNTHINAIVATSPHKTKLPAQEY